MRGTLVGTTDPDQSVRKGNGKKREILIHHHQILLIHIQGILGEEYLTTRQRCHQQSDII